MENCGLFKFFKLYVKDTEEKSLVVDKILMLCNLKKSVKRILETDSHKVYITAKCLKHLYDKKPAQEFESILKISVSLIKYPDKIFKNKPGKKGTYCFIKEIKGIIYFGSLEICNSDIDFGSKNANFIVTAFKIREVGYLKDYELLWSWKGGNSSS